MLNRLKPKSEFSRNVLTLMTGTTIAQAIPIAISPILTRLYTPEDFGVFALFIAITSIFGSIANGRYELAIMLPKKDEDAINIFALGFIINVILSLSLLLIVVAFHDYIVKLLNNNKEISPWLYFFPISVFLMGIFNLLNYFNNRMKQYKNLARANIYKSIGMAIIQLSLGFLKVGAIGLINGQIFSQIISNTKLFFNIKRLNLFKFMSKKNIKKVAWEYRKFLLIDTWVVIIYIIYNRAIIFILQKFYNSQIVGIFFFAERIILFPISFIKNSISNVFFEKISKLSNIEIYNECKKLSFKLFVFSVIPYIIFIYLSKYFIPIVFGDSWKELYLYVIFISLPTYISFLMAPYSYILKILNKQEISLYFHFFKFIIVFLFFIIFHSLSFKEFIFYYCLLDAFVLIIFFEVQNYLLVKKIEFNHIVWMFFILGAIIWFVK